jgi:hypothetical protein
MPKNTMKVFAITAISKDDQFSKADRVDQSDIGWGAVPYTMTLVQARTFAEAEELGRGLAKTVTENTRVIVTKLGDASFVLRSGIIKADGSEA